MTFNVYCCVSSRKEVDPSVAFCGSCDATRYFDYIFIIKACAE